jgi:thiamine-phosphate pyrophosphorylase
MLLVETTLPGGGAVDRVVSQALDGGANAVQLRDRATLRDDLALAAMEIRDVTRGRGLFVINDAPDIASDLHLDGVHLPEAAFDIDRGSITWPFVVGRSIHTVECALRAEDSGCDYVVAGNVYETKSHPGKDGQGLDFLRAVCAAVRIPVFAIGGITAENTPDCIAAGASGVVTRSGILSSRDPRQAAAEFSSALASAWSERVSR